MTINPGSFSNKMFIAIETGSPISTIFLINSKTTPKEREKTVKEAIENNNGVNNSRNNHLSNNGINKHCLTIRFFIRTIKEKDWNILIIQKMCQDNFLLH